MDGTKNTNSPNYQMIDYSKQNEGFTKYDIKSFTILKPTCLFNFKITVKRNILRGYVASKDVNILIIY